MIASAVRAISRVMTRAAGGEAAYNALAGDELARVLAIASRTSFRYVAILPAALLIVFGAIWLYDRSKGGYKPVKISR